MRKYPHVKLVKLDAKYLDFVGSVASSDVWCQAAWRATVTFHPLPITIGTLATLTKMGVLRIVACTGELYQIRNSGRKPNDNGDDSFLACRDPLLSPDLSLYRAPCLILIPPFCKLRNGGECDAYFSTISVVVMYRRIRLYPVTTSFVSF